MLKTKKIKKIGDKEFVHVSGQENCSVVGKPRIYEPGQNCLNDCTLKGMPAHYLSPYT